MSQVIQPDEVERWRREKWIERTPRELSRSYSGLNVEYLGTPGPNPAALTLGQISWPTSISTVDIVLANALTHKRPDSESLLTTWVGLKTTQDQVELPRIIGEIKNRRNTRTRLRSDDLQDTLLHLKKTGEVPAEFTLWDYIKKYELPIAARATLKISDQETKFKDYLQAPIDFPGHDFYRWLCSRTRQNVEDLLDVKPPKRVPKKKCDNCGDPCPGKDENKCPNCGYDDNFYYYNDDADLLERKSTAEVYETDRTLWPKDEVDIFNELNSKEITDQVLGVLTPAQAQVIDYAELKGTPPTQIADRLGKVRSTIYNTHRQGLARLKNPAIHDLLKNSK